MIRKILIANRGEIANRIIRSAEYLDIVPVVIFSDADSGLDYLNTPVEKYLLEGSDLASTYMNGSQIISIAKKCGADAIHPGYGFLAENTAFARQCIENNIIWIGPSPEVMHLMSGKESSRRQAISSGIPVTAAISGTPDELLKNAHQLTWPVLIKAVSGGGGRGMRIIRDPDQFRQQIEIASHEAQLFFGDPRVFVEQYIEKAKHIEVQVIGDKQGNLVHLFERECTVQRRYQKIIEESPSPSLTVEQRKTILSDAVKLAKTCGYDSAGTLEFLVDSSGNHFFMEMNTRIQVEHPVTEMVTGVDLVSEQIRVADGNVLSFTQSDIISKGHSFECRICAEDPAAGFGPSPGKLSHFGFPAIDGIRVDHAVGEGFVISPRFDSMIAKIIVRDNDRFSALKKMQSALNEVIVHGVETTRDFIMEILRHPDFIDLSFSTDFIEKHAAAINPTIKEDKSNLPESIYQSAFLAVTSANRKNAGSKNNPWSNEEFWRQIRSKTFEYNGKTIRYTPELNLQEPNGLVICSIHSDQSVWVSAEGLTYRLTQPELTRKAGNRPGPENEGKNSGESLVYAPIPGFLSRFTVNPGDNISEGDIVAIIESMKTENHILAASKGKAGLFRAREGQQVKLNEVIMEIDTN
jgi:acetyl/propionyl-CoA carboxylase alpha subunit